MMVGQSQHHKVIMTMSFFIDPFPVQQFTMQGNNVVAFGSNL